MEIFRVFDDRTSPCFCSQYPCKQLLTSVYWLHVTQLRPNRILDKNNNNQKNKRKKNATTITFSSIVENYKKMLDIFKLFWQICICHLNHLTEIRQHLKLFRKCPICKPKFWRTSYKWMRARCGREENHVNRNLTCFCCVPDDDDADRRWYDWVVCCFDVWWTALNMEQRQNFVGVLLLIFLSLSLALCFWLVLIKCHEFVCARSSLICDLNEVNLQTGNVKHYCGIDGQSIIALRSFRHINSHHELEIIEIDVIDIIKRIKRIKMYEVLTKKTATTK